MSALKLFIPTGVTSAFGTAIAYGPGPLQWLAISVVVVMVALVVFVVVMRVVGKEKWSTRAADVIVQVVGRARAEPPTKKKKRKKRRRRR